MMRRYITLLTGLLGLYLVACQRGEATLDSETRVSRGGFTLNYTVPRSLASTRSAVAPETGEDLVNSLYVLFFEETTGGTGQYLGYYEVPTHDAEGNLVPLSSEGQVRVKFDEITVTKDPLASVPVTFTPGDAYSLLLVANVDEFLDNKAIETWLSELQGKTENVVLGATLLTVGSAASEDDDSHAIQPGNLPMGARAKRAASQGAVSVELRRSVFRVDVKDGNATDHYELVSASLWNAYPTTPAWENVLFSYKLRRTQRFYGIPVTGGEAVGGLYAFENATTASTATDSVSTCLVLGFKNTMSGRLFYYRANFGVTSTGQRLQRNNAYRVTVKKVNEDGENTELDAYTKGKLQLELEVNEWNVDDQNNVVSDGDNLLAVPTNTIRFSPAAESRSYAIYTVGTATLELSQVHLPAGMTVDLTGNTLTVAVTASNDEREGYVELRFGNLKAVITIRQAGDLSRYVELSRYAVPAFPGNGVFQMEGDVQVSSSGPWSARIYGEGFTFQFRGSDPSDPSPKELFHYPSGHAFTITSLGTNPTLDPRHAFVLVYLDEEPEVNKVLVLSQDGQTTFTMPGVAPGAKIDFDATGATTDRTKFEIVVGGAGDGEWMATVSHPDLFTVKYYDAANNELPGATSMFGHGHVELAAAGPNRTTGELTDDLTIVLLDNEDATRTIPVTQGTFTLQLTGTPVAGIPAMGGTMATPVGVQLSPSWPGATWEAAVTESSVTDHAAYFGTAGTSTATGNVGGTMTLSYAKLPFASARAGATTTVTVTLAGTSVTETFTIPQEVAPWRALTIRSYNSAYGCLTGDGSTLGYYFNTFREAIQNAAYFGTSSSYVLTASSLSFVTGTTPNTSDAIFNSTAADHSSAQITSIGDWWQGSSTPRNANFLMIIDDLYHDDHQDLLRSKNGAFTCAGGGGGSDRMWRAAAPAANTPQRKLWDYIFGGDGPFGAVTSIDLDGDGFNGRLSGYPSSTVPLGMVSTNMVCVAIDPVHQLLYIGDVDMFSTLHSNSFTVNGNNWRYLHNLIAFMVNAAQYGEYFLSDFK
jgi:hypothetical protein